MLNETFSVIFKQLVSFRKSTKTLRSCPFKTEFSYLKLTTGYAKILIFNSIQKIILGDFSTLWFLRHFRFQKIKVTLRQRRKELANTSLGSQFSSDRRVTHFTMRDCPGKADQIKWLTWVVLIPAWHLHPIIYMIPNILLGFPNVLNGLWLFGPRQRFLGPQAGHQNQEK